MGRHSRPCPLASVSARLTVAELPIEIIMGNINKPRRAVGILGHVAEVLPSQVHVRQHADSKRVFEEQMLAEDHD